MVPLTASESAICITIHLVFVVYFLPIAWNNRVCFLPYPTHSFNQQIFWTSSHTPGIITYMGPAFNEQAGETLESSVVQAVSREEQGL